MRPASTFSIIQLSNSRVLRFYYKCYLYKLAIIILVRCAYRLVALILTRTALHDIIPSLTVIKRKNRCILCIYWDSAIFSVVTEYSNLFPSFTFFLNCSHSTFCYEFTIGSKATDIMKIVCNVFSFV